MLITAHARDQRVIASIAIEAQKKAVPALQAIGIVAAIQLLIIEFTDPTRDQRVISGIAAQRVIPAVAF